MIEKFMPREDRGNILKFIGGYLTGVTDGITVAVMVDRLS